MKPVYQRIIDQERGDCWRCCIASILELPAEAVPNFRETERNDMFAIEKWFQSQGLALLELYPRYATDREIGAANIPRWDYICGAYAIASVPSQRFASGTHAVVVQFVPSTKREGAVDLVVAHDPNPGNAPYEIDLRTVKPLWFIVPVVPRVAA
jgi:hypothetical protein